MADANHLVRFALAAVRRAQHLDGVGIADGAQALPEVRGNGPVVGIFHHAFKFTMLDQLAPFAAELEFVARIVDRPRAIGAHQDAVLDTTDHLLQRLIARLDVEVGHAVDRWPVPAAGAAVGNAFEAGTILRQCPTQWPQQQAVADQELFARRSAVVVMAVAGEFFRDARVEGYVEQVGAVLQAAEIAGLDETGAGVIALIAEDAVELQRVTDGFMDLQHHLIRHQQQVARALRGVRREQQLQGLVGDLRTCTDQTAAADDIGATLLAEVLAAEAAGLAVVAVVGGDVEARINEALGLAQFGAGAAQVDLLDVSDADAHLPIDQALILWHRGGFRTEQIEAFAQGREGLFEVG